MPASSDTRPRLLNRGLVVRDARQCRAPHHEGLRPHPEERALWARVSKDESRLTGKCPNRNRLDTDSSDAVRPMASAIRDAIDSVRMLGALLTASVGRIESVMTSSFSPGGRDAGGGAAGQHAVG